MFNGKMRFRRIQQPKELVRIQRMLVREKKTLFCKAARDLFFGLRVVEFREGVGLIGRLLLYNRAPGRFEKVVINFTIGNHRFFGTAKFGRQENLGVIQIAPILYRLERRQHLRIPLLPNLRRSCNVIEWSGKQVFLPGDLHDISLGGAKISVPVDRSRPLRAGSHLKIVLHVKTKWRIEALVEVRRIELGTNELTLGVKFVTKDQNTMRQLQACAMELQRDFIRQDEFAEN